MIIHEDKAKVVIFLQIDTVSVPIKDAALIQKLFFGALHCGAFHQNSSIFSKQGHTKFGKTYLFRVISKGAATTQECPLFEWLR